MEKIVYMLGAGFSAPLGIPVMSNFIEKSKDIYFKNTEKYDHFQTIFNMIREMAYLKNFINSDMFNIEEILSILEMGFLVGDNKKELERYKIYLKDVITHFTPSLNFQRNTSVYWHQNLFSKSKLLNFYGLFIANLFQLKLCVGRDMGVNDSYDFYSEVQEEVVGLGHQYSIVTLNYDLIIENFVSHINQFFRTKSNINLSLNNERIEGSDFYKLNIAKLHGCLSTNIIPPTWNKSSTSDSSILNSWNLAHKLLAEANEIRIIGYSLPLSDSYIKYLMSVSLKNSEHLKKIDVITLDSDRSTKDRYEKMFAFPKFRFKNARFEDFLKLAYEESSVTKKLNVRESKEKTPFGEYQVRMVDLKANIIERAHEQFMS